MISQLARRRILVVEDEALIAMLLEDACVDAGYEVVGPFARLADALAASATQVLDAAILDINLAGEHIHPVAKLLESRQVPFLLLSGYGNQAVPNQPHWPVCAKPFSIDDLLSRLAGLLPSIA
jgi:DNA-binding NtrC family response regulator